MTTVYFIRHAQSDYQIGDERIRPLTKKGEQDSNNLAHYFRMIEIDSIYSSPFQRAIQTILPIAIDKHQEIIIREELRERNIGDWVDDFLDNSKKQWTDFTYSLAGGESLQTVQNRNIRELEQLLQIQKEKTFIIGTHGTALCTILNYYDKEIRYEYFLSIVDKMPFIIRMDFDYSNKPVMQEIEI
jgi:2,3-bisphosphoglycerate-dependent phosphoglycerate mutase